VGAIGHEHPVVRSAVELRPLLRAHRVHSEEQARLSPEVVEAAGKAGLFRLYAPAEVGGLEVPPHVAAEAVMEVAAEDPAVAWYATNSVPAGMAAAWLDETARGLLFADRDRNFGLSGAPTGRATPAPGGYRLSGEWPLVTGVETAAWCALSGFVLIADDTPRMVDGSPDQRLFLVPVADIEVKPVWSDAVAMRGTASQQIRVNEAFVPEEFAFTPAKALRLDRPLYRIPRLTAAAAINAAVSVGVLAGAVDAASADLATRVSTFHGGKATSNGAILEMISRADAAARSLRAGVLDLASELWTAAACEGRPPKQLRAAMHGMNFYAAEVAREMISQLYARSSRASFFRGHPLERALRDIHAISYGFEVLRPFEHGAGLVRMGQDPGVPL
jgi:alkylation response protein AidB-like acyl-CoA dehydrogenase